MRIALDYILYPINSWLKNIVGSLWGTQFVSKVGYWNSYGTSHKYEVKATEITSLSSSSCLYSDHGIELDYCYKKLNAQTNSKYIIVYFCGKKDNYQSNRAEVYIDMQATGLDSFAFNYRGGGNSKSTKPQRFQDLVDDGKAVVKHLMDQGYKPILTGHSTGGPVAFQVAKQLAFDSDKYKVAGCFADRPFSTFSAVAKATLQDFLYFSILAYPIAKLIEMLLNWAKWETNALENWRELERLSIPTSWMNVVNSKEGGYDATIRGEGSLDADIKKYFTQSERNKDLDCLNNQFYMTHKDGWWGKYKGHFTQMDHLKQCNRDGSINKEGITASKFFHNFVNNITKENSNNATSPAVQ